MSFSRLNAQFEKTIGNVNAVSAKFKGNGNFHLTVAIAVHRLSHLALNPILTVLSVVASNSRVNFVTVVTWIVPLRIAQFTVR